VNKLHNKRTQGFFVSFFRCGGGVGAVVKTNFDVFLNSFVICWRIEGLGAFFVEVVRRE